MPWHPVASGMCDRNVNAADGVGSLQHEPRTHPAHADGRLVYNGADRDGQNGNPRFMEAIIAMTQPMTCTKCGGSMELGFMVEHGHGSSDHQVRWVEGEPTLRVFFHTVKLGAREPVPVTTYRCDGCGYLESFAKSSA